MSAVELAALLLGSVSAHAAVTNIVDGITTNVAGDYYVGYAGVGNQLTIGSGGQVFSIEGNIGYTNTANNNAVTVTGALTNNNATLTVSLLSFVPTNGSQFVIVDSAVSMIGTFLGAPEGSTNYFGSSEPFAITYAGGADNHDIVLTTVPEPSSFLLVAVAASLLAVGVRQRRRR